MDLMTKCPQCGTVFPASLSQLQLRKGYIRCISCANIFDGYEAVVPAGQGAAPAAPSAAPSVPSSATPWVAPSAAAPAPRSASPWAPSAAIPPATPPAPMAAAPSVVRQRNAGTSGTSERAAASRPGADPAAQASTWLSDPIVRIADDDLPAAGRPEPGLHSGYETQDEPAAAFSGVYAEPRRGAVSGSGHIEPSVAAYSENTDTLPDFLYTRRQRRHGFARLFWSVLVLAGLVFLAAQLAYVYRTQIAMNAPLLRPLLEQACVSLRCTVGYSRRIEHISIMDSSLQAASRNAQLKPDESAMLLRVVLRNSYSKPQAWPTLTLDLVDFSGSVVVRRRLAPKDYLPADVFGQPFAANSERQITVPITVSGVKINGYQLGKFYSPEG